MIGQNILSHFVGMITIGFIWISYNNSYEIFQTEALPIAIVLETAFWLWIICKSWNSYMAGVPS